MHEKGKTLESEVAKSTSETCNSNSMDASPATSWGGAWLLDTLKICKRLLSLRVIILVKGEH